MKALKMALALALTAASAVVAPTSVSANPAAESARYICFYEFSFEADGWIYDVYTCYPFDNVV